ncbi:MAG TPA: magnesium-translocating P-type ATPase [Vicinamibacterales bacterium]|jgi:Mg2+-importing ATPase|nr:magnesium-translocating P-type ATPase [Vicinamibacterales bacterium]
MTNAKKAPAGASDHLIELARADEAALLEALHSQSSGLAAADAEERLQRDGPNEIAREKRRSPIIRLLLTVRNPLVVLLSVLGLISFLTGDISGTLVILTMVVLGVALRFVQETRADHAAEQLKAMVRNTATVIRDGRDQELPLSVVVRGDVVRLAAGDMVPADVRVLTAKDLFVNQSALTGEALPVEKHPGAAPADVSNPFDLPNLAFLGSNVESGTATAVAIHTGERTFFGSLAASIAGERQLTSFDQGINRFTWLMIQFMAVMVPAVFLINGISKHNWLEAFLFALAVAVGLTPEMLPMIVTVNLSKGALAMARKKVVVKRLNAIQNFGAMDVLCTDKTGTITEGRIVLERYIDAHGAPDDKVLNYAYVNSYHHTGLRNLMDEAILKHQELEQSLQPKDKYRKIDEVPFDFVRRRMSVVVEDETGLNTLICKGAVDEMLGICTRVEIKGKSVDARPAEDAALRQMVMELSGQGFRVIALGYKEMPDAPDKPVYSVKDESDLTLLGFLAFLDPPKASAAEALKRLHDLNTDVKILTGDNEMVTGFICGRVGIPSPRVLMGREIEKMSDQELTEAALATTVFARLVPAHKERIIRALQRAGHVVGFLGDGINDAPALKAADVGISVNSAVDIAKESSDIILLEQSLLVLESGVVEGRKVFGNIIKYVKMAASSNFGNMFSVVGASAFLPFLPMQPIQVLANNLLYDFSQTTIPTDNVDPEWLKKPRRWAIGDIRRFIVVIGPISSIFDYLTYFIMLYVFNAWKNPALFQTGWFVESIFTQTLIIHVIRTNKIPFIESRASWPLTATSIVIVAIGAWLTVSPLAGPLGLVRLPRLYWLFLAGMLLGYVALTQVVKSWFVRRFGE